MRRVCWAAVLAILSALGCATGANDGIAGSATGTGGGGGPTGAGTGAGRCGPLCPASGCVVETVAGVQDSAFSIVLDETSVYWIDLVNSTFMGPIMRAPKMGGPAEALVATTSAPNQLAVAPQHRLFWTESGDPANGAVRSIAIDGGSISTIVAGVRVDDPPVAVDRSSVYWVQHAIGDTDDEILFEAPIAGGAAQQLATVDELASYVALDDTSVYVGVLGGGVVAVPKHGGASRSLTEGGDVRALSVQNGTVYFVVFEWSLEAVDIDGGNARTLFQSAATSNAVATDAEAVYWFDGSVLMRLCLDGSQPPEVLTSAGTYAIAVDDTGVYFDNTTSIGKIAK